MKEEAHSFEVERAEFHIDLDKIGELSIE